MKKLMTIFSAIFTLVFFLFSYYEISVTLNQEFSLGGMTDKDTYLFVKISDIKVDNLGNIYILDSIRQRVQVYDQSQNYIATIGTSKFNSRNMKEWRSNIENIKRGEIKEIELEELYFPQKMFLKNEKIYILDLNKVVIYSKENEFLGGITYKNIKAHSVFINKKNEIVVAGVKNESNHFLHVFNEKGDFQFSFGEYFKIPKSIKSGIPNNVEQKSIAFPSDIYYSEEENEFYCMNPFEYDIHIYQDNVLIRKIRLPAKDKQIIPPQGLGRFVQGKPVYSISYITSPTLLRMGNHIFVFSANLFMPSRIIKNYNLEIYKDFNLSGEYSIDIVNPAFAVDQEGSLYCVEFGAEQSKVVKYRTNIADFLL